MNLKELLKKEEGRQHDCINLIPSENYALPEVRKAAASVFANKYSEGYPGRRYYPGNEWVDQVEVRAQDLARRAFKISKQWHVNVQAYSGSPANIACFLGVTNYLRKQKGINKFPTLCDGARSFPFLGFRLDAGGHLTHGHRVNLSGSLFNFEQYGLGKDGWIDYQAVEKMARKVKPKLIVCGLTAYSRKIDFEKFSKISKKVGALLMADIAHIAGLISGGAHPSPFAYADIVTTTTHKTLRGPRGALIFVRQQKNDSADISLASEIDKALFPGIQGGPHDHQTYAIAVALEQVLKPSFKKYARQIVRNAEALAQVLIKRGLDIVSGGTDNHLMLIDLKALNLDGMLAEQRLYEAGIVVNRNSLPGDPSPFRPSGLRLGTPAVTTRGMKELEMKKIGELIADSLLGLRSLTQLRAEVRKLTSKFPVP